MMRLLVTGVSGLLGLNLAYQTAERFQVTGVLRGQRAVAVPGCTPFDVIEADLTKPGQIERVLDAAQPDVVIHCAALTDVDRCEMSPADAQLINAHLPGVLARAVAKRGTRLLHISTDAIFDGLRGDYIESDQPNPINVYARTKLEGEQAVAEANPDALIARVNFYGWSWQGDRSLAEFFFNHLSIGEPVHGFDDLTFCPLLVNDMIEILLRLLEHRLAGIYHVVSAESLSKYAFGRMVARAFGFDERLITPASFKTGNLRAPRSPRLTLRSDRLASALGEEMPRQQSGILRFAELHRLGYPQLLRSVLVNPNHSFAE